MSPADVLQQPDELLGRFGLTRFRSGQEAVIRSVLEGRDVLCVMPTGGGKSLCYQFPGLALPGVTLVVSPLIALMKDQVDSLRQRGIPAALLNSSQTGSEQAEVMRQMAQGDYKLVYVAPERLRNRIFQESVRDSNVGLLAVDEAHCVSEWGHDFRPDYARLGLFRERYLNNVQTIALTATATPMVRDDIQKLLQLRQPQCYVTGFRRENLYFSVTHTRGDGEKDEALLRYMRDQTGVGIIYAATRKRCEELAEWLPERLGRRVGVYHAGLDGRQRHEIQNAFMAGELSAIVATNAFGMGIDKADIRYVVHYNIPGSLEAYYQEAGRAGRDGLPSECRLFFAYSDRYVQEFFIENRYPNAETVEQVYRYLLSRPEDPIELTLQEVRDGLGGKVATESISTAETLLAKAGVLKRLDASANHAIIRIDSDAPTLQDMLPREAKTRRKVIAACESLIGGRRGEDVYVRLQQIMQITGMERDALTRTFRELTRLNAFDYVPPFRGRAVHFLRRDLTFAELPIDFEELARRKGAEYDKLEAVIQFARSSRCRQLEVLDYFGDPNAQRCGNCDLCRPGGAATQTGASAPLSQGALVSGVDSEALTTGIRIALSGVARMHGRFGKQMIAQMLCGSSNKKIQQWKLNRLSTFGMLNGLKQSQVSNVLEAICDAGLAEQSEVDERRPTVRLTTAGHQVMTGKTPVPNSFRLAFPLAKQLAACAAGYEAADVRSGSVASPGHTSDVASESAVTAACGADGIANDAGGTGDAAVVPSNDAEATAGNEKTKELLESLRRWRRKVSAALAIPAFRVLSNATLERVAEMQPTSTDQLQEIKGVGPNTLEQFGYDIVELVITVTTADDQGPTVPEDDSAASTSVTEESLSDGQRDQLSQSLDDSFWTWQLFNKGFTHQEVAAIRRLPFAMIVQHLILCQRRGRMVKLQWVCSKQQQATIEAELNEHPGPAAAAKASDDQGLDEGLWELAALLR